MFKGKIVDLKKIFIAFLFFILNNTTSFAASQANMDFQLEFPEFLRIQTVTIS